VSFQSGVVWEIGCGMHQKGSYFSKIDEKRLPFFIVLKKRPSVTAGGISRNRPTSIYFQRK
jgi:hypothetical protein